LIINKIKYIILILIIFFCTISLYADENSTDTSVDDIYKETLKNSEEITDSYTALKADLVILESLLMEIEEKYATGKVLESDLVLLDKILDELEARARNYSK